MGPICTRIRNVIRSRLLALAEVTGRRQAA